MYLNMTEKESAHSKLKTLVIWLRTFVLNNDKAPKKVQIDYVLPTLKTQKDVKGKLHNIVFKDRAP